MSIFHARRAALTRARRLIHGFAALSALGQSPVRMCRAAFIPLLHERLTRSESGAHPCAAICGAAAPFLIPHSELCIMHYEFHSLRPRTFTASRRDPTHI